MSFPNFDELPGISVRSVVPKLDLFFDLQCPYSKLAWETIGASLQDEWQSSMDIRFHAICLSHHRQSWNLTLSLFAIRALKPSAVFSYIDTIYADHEQFYNARWSERSERNLVEHVVDVTSSATSLSAQEIGMALGSDAVFAEAKKSIRYAALKQVWSTPTVFYNDIEQEQLSSSSPLSEWEALISK